jgi:hypothetical protein
VSTCIDSPERGVNPVLDFYDELAPLYHLIHQDWNERFCGGD